MTADPLAPLPVSVVIPAYNRAALIARAVTSAQAQRPAPPAQIIVVDDCSSDDTADVAARLGVTVVRLEVNRGRSGARNSGIDAMAHDWVAFLDSDDEWLPDHLARLWPRRSRHAVVASSALSTGPDGTFLIGCPSARPLTVTTQRELLIPQNPLPLSGSLVRGSALREVGGFSAWDTAEDLDLWLRLIGRGSILLCPEPGFLYHVHSGQVSGDLFAMQRDVLAMLDTHRDETWCTPALRDTVEVTLRWDRLRAAQWAGDRATMRRSARWLLERPRRLVDLVGVWVWRDRVKRRTAAVVGPELLAVAAAASASASVHVSSQNTRSV